MRRVRVDGLLLLGFAMTWTLWVHAQSTVPETRKVSTVDIFGYSGWDRDDPSAGAARKQLAAQVGAEVRLAGVAAFRRHVQGEVVAATGKPATDVAVICCDAAGELNVFVGIQGEEAIPLEQRATPTGLDTLPPEAFSLYEDAERAEQAASARGVVEEDDSQGYALAKGASLHTLQERMRTSAIGHVDVIIRVLRGSAVVQQRRAAAALLGYAERSPAQSRALMAALDDDDDAVRANAARALAVLAAGGTLPGFNVRQILGLLYSGVWTDRHQASILLERLTIHRDAKLLKTLREQALPPLIEGAQWQAKPYAAPFAVVLGRVVGMRDERIAALVGGGHIAEIVQDGMTIERAGSGH